MGMYKNNHCNNNKSLIFKNLKSVTKYKIIQNSNIYNKKLNISSYIYKFSTINNIVREVLFLNYISSIEDLNILINSPGGSISAGLSLFDIMTLTRCNISTTSVGLSASMGAFLLASGTNKKRYSFAHSRIMIHQPLGGSYGNAVDIEIQANEILF